MLWRITCMIQVWRVQMTVSIVVVQSVRQPQKFKPSPHPRLSFSQHFPKKSPQWRWLSTPLSSRKKPPALTETARRWTRWECRCEWCHFCSGCMIITSFSSSNGYFTPAHQCYQPLTIAKSLDLVLTPGLHWILQHRRNFWTWPWPDFWPSCSFLSSWGPFRFVSLRFYSSESYWEGGGVKLGSVSFVVISTLVLDFIHFASFLARDRFCLMLMSVVPLLFDPFFGWTLSHSVVPWSGFWSMSFFLMNCFVVDLHILSNVLFETVFPRLQGLDYAPCTIFLVSTLSHFLFINF